MAYTIKNTDGTTLLLLGNGKIDSNSTSLTLVGKNFSSYGEIWNNNLIKLLGNFSKVNPPTNPLKGQLWYDSLNQRLNVYDDGWEAVGGVQISSTEPSTLSTGDLWWIPTKEQLYIKTSAGNKLVGPAFPVDEVGTNGNGWVLPSPPVEDNTNGTSGIQRQVTLLKNYGDTVGYITTQSFTIATTATNAYLTNNTTSTVNGLTIFGDVQTTGTVYTNSLNVSSNIVYPESERVSRIEDLDFFVGINNIAVRVRDNSGQYIPEIRAVTGSADISFAGFYVRVTEPIRAISQVLTTVTTTSIPIITDITNYFSNVGDMLQIICTDQTDISDQGIRTYRITIQFVGTGKPSISLEKLV
jgi:hypothetical protein